MKSEKKQPIDKMYFVYTLCYNESIFYVGRTKDIHNRYKQHINKKNPQYAGQIIQQILNAGHYPELNIVTYTTYTHASNIEETLIKCLSAGGQYLYNTQCGQSNRYYKIAKKCITSKKEALSAIITNQNKYIDMCNSYQGYYIVPTIGERHFSLQNTVHHKILPLNLICLSNR